MKQKKIQKLFSFQDFDYTDIDDLISMESDGKIVKMWCRNIKLHFPYQEKSQNGSYKAKSRVTLMDQYGNKMESLEIPKSRYEKLKKYKRKGLPVEMLAKVVKGKIRNVYINMLKILRVRPGDSPLRQMRASKLEEKLVKDYLFSTLLASKTGSRWELFEAIREACIEYVGIIGTDIDDLFNDAIDGSICQAFSGGTVNSTNGKISTCVIGPSASGKKLLWGIAKLLNIVSEESQSIRVTPAGITAVMKKDLTLGKIPLANGGVFGIQDFDKARNKYEILPIFSDVMEDGVCILSGATKAKLEAKTAIHIDINRFSDLYLKDGGSINVTDDTGLPTNIISRFDFIIELKKDTLLQSKKVTELLRKPSDANADKGKGKIAVYCRKKGIDLDRFLKLIVAFVMTEFKDIDRRPVTDYMAEKLSQIERANKSNLDKVQDISMFQMRLANSFIKFVNALTRIQLLKKSNREAVDKALHLLSRKLDFLKCVNENYVIPSYRKMGPEAFQRWLRDKYGNKTFAPKDVIREYTKANSPCGEKSVRTLLYWIAKTSIKKKQGVWKVKKA